MVRSVSLVALASCLASSSAFVPAALPRTRMASRISMIAGDEDRSQALPYDRRPEALDGSLVGDVGFDPVGFSSSPPKEWLYGGETRSLKWYRESELVHGRVAMLAVLGWIVPEFIHFPGNAAVGVDAFAQTNPLAALKTVPETGLWQIAAAVSAIEFYRIQRVIRGDAEPGDLGLGQGEGSRINPFGFNYSEEQYREKQLQEIKNGRLAMIAIIGLLLQANVTGQGIIEQLSGSLALPEAVSKAGYYFPEGI